MPPRGGHNRGDQTSNVTFTYLYFANISIQERGEDITFLLIILEVNLHSIQSMVWVKLNYIWEIYRGGGFCWINYFTEP